MRFLLAGILLLGFSLARAGSFDDFFRSVRQDDAEAITALLRRGFDANTQDEKGRTGLFLALQEGYPEVAQVLATWPGTQVNALDEAGESALMLACLHGNEAVAHVLVERGADVNKPGWTPLHYAATGGQEKLVAFLLDQNAYIDAESPNGSTPLMMAAQYGSPGTVKLLLEQGADPLLRNKLGLTALDFARRGERPDAIAMLTRAMAQVRRERPPGKW